MQVHVRTRRSKIRASAQVPGDFQIYDNATALSVVKRVEVDREAFLARLARKAPKNTVLLTMCKDPKQCGDAEKFHFSEVHWTDRVSKERYVLIFDTLVFITNDAGDTTQNVQG